MTYREACPNCGEELNYIVDDYSDNFYGELGEQEWKCSCLKCGCKFTITRTYKLTNVAIEEVSEG